MADVWVPGWGKSDFQTVESRDPADQIYKLIYRSKGKVEREVPWVHMCSNTRLVPETLHKPATHTVGHSPDVACHTSDLITNHGSIEYQPGFPVTKFIWLPTLCFHTKLHLSC